MLYFNIDLATEISPPLVNAQGLASMDFIPET